MHIKKAKGDVGVVFAVATATEQGWAVSLPITEHASYDFIMEKSGICKRVQVRYTTPKNGVMEVKLRSCWADRNGSHTRNRQIEDFDILAVFNPENKQTYFVASNCFSNGTGLSLRLVEPKKPMKNMRMARDFQTI